MIKRARIVFRMAEEYIQMNHIELWEIKFSTLIKVKINYIPYSQHHVRGVPIIGSATISGTDMVFFTNIGIGTEQEEDRNRYRYLYSSNSLYINGLCIGLLRYLCGSGSLAYCSLCNKRYKKPYKYTRF